MNAIIGTANGHGSPGAAAQARLVALATLLLHLSILPYDIATGFRAFTWGDRGIERLRMVDGFAHARGSAVAWMTDAPVVPGEYLFAWGPWALAGPIGVILVQILLATIAAWLVARIAGRVVPWPRAALGCGLVYALLPQNIAFPHQLVTEAIATPFCVAWLALLLAAVSGPVRSGRILAFAAAGLCIGIAILIRPVIVAMLPIAYVLTLLVPAARAQLRGPGLYVMATIGLAPLLLWTAIFTAQTGQFGYNKGSANFGWNLRSKALITERANGIAPPADLLPDDGGISAGRFFQEVALHKPAFARAFLLDAVTVFGRGNSTKISVDYLGIDRDPTGWRQKLLYARDAKASRGSNTLNPVYVIEGLASLLTALFFAFCAWQAARIGVALVRGTVALSPECTFLTIVASAWLINVFVSAQIVNEAQGRLRNPAEAAFILFAAMAFALRRHFPRPVGSGIANGTHTP
ncbi:ArnT family glycosyltransferase [Sphingomonas montana]|uniref:ArnT family glycosyltransferase n=1 Tax=Sphingomonas montana TaxID=1843236 RepID=UPI0013ED787D|nr:hypothetical protein [Sphingomonas montana]